jgi:hypothetical protein
VGIGTASSVTRLIYLQEIFRTLCDDFSPYVRQPDAGDSGDAGRRGKSAGFFAFHTKTGAGLRDGTAFV